MNIWRWIVDLLSFMGVCMPPTVSPMINAVASSVDRPRVLTISLGLARKTSAPEFGRVCGARNSSIRRRSPPITFSTVTTSSSPCRPRVPIAGAMWSRPSTGRAGFRALPASSVTSFPIRSDDQRRGWNSSSPSGDAYPSSGISHSSVGIVSGSRWIGHPTPIKRAPFFLRRTRARS